MYNKISTDYVVQDRRYNIYEDLGPFPDTSNVTLAYPLYLIWEPIMCITSAIFGVLTVRLILKRRKLLNEVFNSGTTRITQYTYIRLLSIALSSAVIHAPLSTWAIIVTLTEYGIAPWISWENMHSNYGHPEYISRFLFSTQPHEAIYASISWWSLPLCGILFFIFFGFGEAATPYQPLITACLMLFGIQYPGGKEKVKYAKRTRLDIIIHRPGKLQVEEGSGLRNIPRFRASYTAGQNSQALPQ
jgi:pheromone a factor receptor